MSAVAIPGWARAVRDDAVELVAPEGPAGGVITVRARVRPLLRLDELVARWAGPDVEMLAPPARVDTDEGEHGAVVAVIARRGDARLRVELGIVVGDGSYDVVVGVVAADAPHAARLAAEVRRLVERVRLGLGVRRRLVLHDRPAGWRGCPRGLETDWLAPGFPDDPARLTVFPAVPAVGVTAVDAATRLAAEAAAAPALAGAEWIDEIRTTPRGLRVMIRSAAAGGRAVDLAVASDGRYVYAVRLERRAGDPCRRIFDATVDSLVPVPVERAEIDEGLAHWAM
ncbi:MAG: hypothetical protein H6708_34585 [Kofleriaceae bacterium]|nr:hypothetical protein [Kofleriaceae bacterium]